MLAMVCFSRLRERAGMTQGQHAECIGVGQRQVSKIESDDLDSAKVGTIRRYLEAVGGDPALEYVAGDQRVQVALSRPYGDWGCSVRSLAKVIRLRNVVVFRFNV